MTFPENLPRSIRIGLTWVVCTGLLATWAGWLEAPWSVAAKQRAEVTAMAGALQKQGEAITALGYEVRLLQFETAERKDTLQQLDTRIRAIEQSVYTLSQRVP